MKGLAANYRYYQSLWIAFGDKKALAKSKQIIKSIPNKSLSYFWDMV